MAQIKEINLLIVSVTICLLLLVNVTMVVSRTVVDQNYHPAVIDTPLQVIQQEYSDCIKHVAYGSEGQCDSAKNQLREWQARETKP